MKVLHLSTGDAEGGAFRATYRIHRALVAAGVDSRMRVLLKSTDDDLVTGTRWLMRRVKLKLEMQRLWHRLRARGWHTDNPVWHSFGWYGAGIVDELNACDADILHLHWIPELLSVKDIGRLRKPIVWTLHDMWPMCGGEHYAPDDDGARFRQGYRADNRPSGERGPDLNRRVWEAKRKHWADQPFTFACPSRWMANNTRESVLFASNPVHVIPNCLETQSVWRPVSPATARAALGLPQEKSLIMFGADGGTQDSRKGGDLLREAVARVAATQGDKVELLVFGQGRPRSGDVWPCPVHWLGVVRDDRVLALACSAADVAVVPSRQDNLPNVALEAMACGTPVVAFETGGLPDIVDHRQTGWLAKVENAEDLAQGIMWVLEANRDQSLSIAAHNQAVARFSEPVVAAGYSRLYQDVLGQR